MKIHDPEGKKERVKRAIEGTQTPVKYPREIYAIWCDEPGFFCLALDNIGEPMLMFFNRRDAEAAREFQEEEYELGPCRVVRIR